MDEAARVDNPGEVYHKNVQQLDITVDPNVWDTDKIPTSMMVGKYCERIARSVLEA